LGRDGRSQLYPAPGLGANGLGVKIHVVDGTYELFRAWFGAPNALDSSGREVGATRGLLNSLNALLRDENVSHIACAYDHVIESFRNQLFGGYKTGEGLPAELTLQFELAERAAHALGIVVWPMIEFEADDALATAAARFAASPEVEQIVICSPDKDLAQCVRGTRVVCLDRLRRRVLDEPGVVARFGVPPESIPDWLALVGDDADGIPGIPRWGARSAAAVLAEYRSIEAIPDDAASWKLRVRGAQSLARELSQRRSDALLYKRLAVLRTDVPLPETLADLEWRGARRDELTRLTDEIGARGLLERVSLWRV
jgi:5'-3' exonuclease